MRFSPSLCFEDCVSKPGVGWLRFKEWFSFLWISTCVKADFSKGEFYLDTELLGMFRGDCPSLLSGLADDGKKVTKPISKLF